MERSVVLFGPAEAGKSTLGGYLRAKLDPDFDINAVISKVKKTGNYDESQKFAYIMDTAADERIRLGDKKLGTTKYMHIERINMGDYDITVIDTPGAQHIYHARIRGIYYGDIGIFMIEARKLVKHRLLSMKSLNVLHEFFMPLFIWLNFKTPENKLIILISKMDNMGYSEKEFDNAVQIIKTLCDDLSSATFIPVSIDVKNENDENVIAKNDKMDWYFGPTLISTLKNIYEDKKLGASNEPLFMTVEREFDKEFGKILRGKIISGMLSKGDAINISPIYNKGYKTASAKVKNIRISKGGDVEQAEKGSIVSLLIDDITIGRSKIPKNKLSTIPTSAITDQNTPIKMGNMFKFRLSLEDAEKFSLREMVGVLWFGRMISTHVISKKITSDVGYVYLEPYNIVASLIATNTELYFKDFLLKKSQEFKQANLESIGYATQLEYIVDNFEIKKEKIPYIFEGFNFTTDNNKLIFKDILNYSDLILRIKRFESKFSEYNRNLYELIDLKIQ